MKTHLVYLIATLCAAGWGAPVLSAQESLAHSNLNWTEGDISQLTCRPRVNLGNGLYACLDKVLEVIERMNATGYQAKAGKTHLQRRELDSPDNCDIDISAMFVPLIPVPINQQRDKSLEISGRKFMNAEMKKFWRGATKGPNQWRYKPTRQAPVQDRWNPHMTTFIDPAWKRQYGSTLSPRQLRAQYGKAPRWAIDVFGSEEAYYDKLFDAWYGLKGMYRPGYMHLMNWRGWSARDRANVMKHQPKILGLELDRNGRTRLADVDKYSRPVPGEPYRAAWPGYDERYFPRLTAEQKQLWDRRDAKVRARMAWQDKMLRKAFGGDETLYALHKAMQNNAFWESGQGRLVRKQYAKELMKLKFIMTFSPRYKLATFKPRKGKPITEEGELSNNWAGCYDWMKDVVGMKHGE